MAVNPAVVTVMVPVKGCAASKVIKKKKKITTDRLRLSNPDVASPAASGTEDFFLLKKDKQSLVFSSLLSFFWEHLP